LAHVLRSEGADVKQQLALPIRFEGVQIDAGYRIDLLVEDAVVVELKCVEGVLPVHRAQLLSYLKLSGKKVGLLINFNVAHLRDGIERLVNRF
jgi:GxxExxY protein